MPPASSAAASTPARARAPARWARRLARGKMPARAKALPKPQTSQAVPPRAERSFSRAPARERAPLRAAPDALLSKDVAGLLGRARNADILLVGLRVGDGPARLAVRGLVRRRIARNADIFLVGLRVGD